MIANVRVDDRLLHGQVTQGWVPALGIKMIGVLSERVCCDSVAQMVMKLGAPHDLNLEFRRPAELAHDWNQLNQRKESVMILTDQLDQLDAAIEAGANPDSVTLGNVHAPGAELSLTKTVECSASQLSILRRWLKRGSRLEIRSGVHDRPEPLETHPCLASNP